jgi:hypothetical protein
MASGAPLAATISSGDPSCWYTCVTARRSGRRPYSHFNVRPSCGERFGSRRSAPRAWNAFSMGSKGSRALARIPYSRSVANLAWSGPLSPWRQEASPARRVTIVMRFCVRVPVLSVQSTVAAPSVSIAATRRVRTRAREMRQAPITMKTVRTSGNSSGSIDMPSAMPLSKASSHPPRHKPYSTTARALRLRLTAAKSRTRRRVWARSRGGSVSMRVIARPILPISLRAPVAVTSARPWPRTTRLPE